MPHTGNRLPGNLRVRFHHRGRNAARRLTDNLYKVNEREAQHFIRLEVRTGLAISEMPGLFGAFEHVPNIQLVVMLRHTRSGLRQVRDLEYRGAEIVV